MLNNILQWNINSLKSKFSKLETILKDNNIQVFALQKTKNPTGKQIKIRGYNIYAKDRDAHGGGVLVAVHKNIPSTQLHIDTNLELVASTVHFKNYHINICSFYLPDHTQITFENLNDIFNKIPNPKIILGDVNAKHVSWGAAYDCPRGKIITDCILDNNLVILNDGSPTRYDIRRNIYSHIDISCCSLALADKLDWAVTVVIIFLYPLNII